jgi:hypothetical protein
VERLVSWHEGFPEALMGALYSAPAQNTRGSGLLIFNVLGRGDMDDASGRPAEAPWTLLEAERVLVLI